MLHFQLSTLHSALVKNVTVRRRSRTTPRIGRGTGLERRQRLRANAGDRAPFREAPANVVSACRGISTWPLASSLVRWIACALRRSQRIAGAAPAHTPDCDEHLADFRKASLVGETGVEPVTPGSLTSALPIELLEVHEFPTLVPGRPTSRDAARHQSSRTTDCCLCRCAESPSTRDSLHRRVLFKRERPRRH